ncbi:Uu.00g102850.m01.CDS01 [Anthostomella pinea]|uniref:Uu.00g102850.m01.CDS01 n=1 Tax=Anthostomella pinea TaxID=933095 RepID=A0AAI8YFJ3_9PEZI|nr:Uu.00g102850.m01.CDS01 [Anthostomella pinea]
MPNRFEDRDVGPASLGGLLSFPFSPRVAPNRFTRAAMTEYLTVWGHDNMVASGIHDTALTKLYGHWDRGAWVVVHRVRQGHRAARGGRDAMVDALRSGLEGSGIARVSAMEPVLPPEILLVGPRSCIKAKGVVNDEKDIGSEPIDPSDQESFDAFLEDFAAWVASLPAMTLKEPHGHVSIRSTKVIPYGVIAALPV